MFSKFFSLEKEKQDRIINAAIKEFARKGYDRASTNEIVKEAEISKGLLFHYFGNKKKLFFFLFDYCIELITEEFYKKMDFQETDFFARIWKAILTKMDLLAIHPDLFKFFEHMFLDESAEIKEELETRKKEITSINFGRIYEGIDMTKFREDVEPEKILKIITWTFERLSDEALREAKLTPEREINYPQVVEETKEYIEVLKQVFYQ
ncbi:TetR/AcrR family transcriptional regulator [Neobacillus muris]|uniref:TetR/AcrR family transcriptional regulator n=1 Tax=Neobacillus muris TaxID=2941334 RepID=UPI00203EEB81|nr:TetR/AcrR family transcriptional regulator [Neobacillus muris]